MEAGVNVGQFKHVGHAPVVAGHVEVNETDADAEGTSVLVAVHARLILRVVPILVRTFRLQAASGRVWVLDGDGVRCGNGGQREGVCTDASAEQIQQQLAHVGDGVRDFEGDAVQTNANAELVRRLGEARVDHDGVGLGLLHREIEREALEQTDLEEGHVVPKRISGVDLMHAPLENGTDPQGFWNQPWQRPDAAARGDVPTLAALKQTLDRQFHDDVVGSIPVDVDVIVEEVEVRTDRDVAGEGT